MKSDEEERRLILQTTMTDEGCFFIYMPNMAESLEEDILHGEIRSNTDQLPVIVEDKR